jgi:hypothetical protein
VFLVDKPQGLISKESLVIRIKLKSGKEAWKALETPSEHKFRFDFVQQDSGMVTRKVVSLQDDRNKPKTSPETKTEPTRISAETVSSSSSKMLSTRTDSIRVPETSWDFRVLFRFGPVVAGFGVVVMLALQASRDQVVFVFISFVIGLLAMFASMKM